MSSKYFNNAGAGLMSQGTYNTVIEHMQLEMEIGAYKAATEKANSISKFYSLSAKMLHADFPEEIAYVDSASRGWNLILYGLPITSKDIIVTLASEYGTNLLTIYDIAHKTGCSVRIVPCDEIGNFDINDVENELKAGGTVLAVSHVAAQGSIVNPVIELGHLTTKYGALYIVDGCQAAGQIPINVKDIGCTSYITAGRKWLRGPRGTGILYVKKGSPIHTPQIDLASSDLIFDRCRVVSGLKIREDARQFELWEKNTAAFLGLANAISEYLEYGEAKVSEDVLFRANLIRKHIIQNRKLSIVGEAESLSGVSSFYLKDASLEDSTKKRFEHEGFIISIICDWDCPLFFPKEATSIFRISPHYYTSKEAVEDVCRLIDSI